MVVNSEVFLERWSESVAIAPNSKVNYPNYLRLNDQYSVKPEGNNGWYGYYPEGLFYFFRDDKGRIFIGVNEVVVPVKMVESAIWTSNLRARYFICLDRKGQVILDFKYRTLRRFIRNPLKLITEFFIPDDDWGLESDVPSFVHSRIKCNDFNEIFEKLIDKN